MVASPTTAETNSVALGLLIFDGDCGFCTKSARKFADFAGESAATAPWQALDLDDYGLTEEDVSTASYWVQDGETFRGADGFVHALQVCRKPWPLIGRIMGTVPVIWLARAVYPIIAKNRHRLPGASEACALPRT